MEFFELLFAPGFWKIILFVVVSFIIIFFFIQKKQSSSTSATTPTDWKDYVTTLNTIWLLCLPGWLVIFVVTNTPVHGLDNIQIFFKVVLHSVPILIALSVVGWVLYTKQLISQKASMMLSWAAIVPVILLFIIFLSALMVLGF